MVHLDALESLPPFLGVSKETLGEISCVLRSDAWPKGSQIFAPPGKAQRFWIVRRGRVKIVRTSAHNGRELTLWLLQPGDGFDIVSLLDGSPHPETAWALDDVVTVSAPMAVWLDWLERFPRLRLNMLRQAGEKLSEVAELATDVALSDTPTRLAHLLLRDFDPSGANLLADLPHKELAAMIGSVRVVVSRLLGQLRRQNIVELRHGSVHAVDLKRLLQLAEGQLEQQHKAAPKRIAAHHR